MAHDEAAPRVLLRLVVALVIVATAEASQSLITAEDLQQVTDGGTAGNCQVSTAARWRSQQQDATTQGRLERRVARHQRQLSHLLPAEERHRHRQLKQQQQQQQLALLKAWTWDQYHTYNETVTFLAALAIAYPDSCSVESIGKSVLGRDLLVLQATRVAAPSASTTADTTATRTRASTPVVLGRPCGRGDLEYTLEPPANQSSTTGLAWLRMGAAPGFSKPLVALVGNMHGDEDVNRQVLLQYALQLCSGGALGGLGGGSGAADDDAQAAQRIVALLENTVVQILPCMNPDSGFAPGLQRTNALGVDLNRNFWTQDFLNSYDRPTSASPGALQSSAARDYLSSGAAEAQPETRAVMGWLRKALPRLSGNLHGGALVASYLKDACDQLGLVTSCPTPQDPLPQFLALSYALNHAGMRASREFANGTTQGATWYPALGTLQDWVYNALGGRMHVTFELHEDKTLTGLGAAQLVTQLPGYYAANRQALLRFCEVAHLGLRVRLVDQATGAPLAAQVALMQPASTSSGGAPELSVRAGEELSLMALPGLQYQLSVRAFSPCNASAWYAPVMLTYTLALGWDQALRSTGLGGLGEVQLVAVQAA